MDEKPAPPPKLAEWPHQMVLASRWLLVVFYAVLVVALAAFSVAFVVHTAELLPKLFAMSESDLILALLGLVDASLVASLVVMVIISGYDNFVGQISAPEQALPWLGSLDAGGLKIKIATSIVAISSIQLLEMFVNADHYTSERLAWAIGLQFAFVVTALGLGVLERLTRH